MNIDNKTISVVINTYNAEEHLREVLDAVKGFDEIVVCDMESTDSTTDIARRYGCKIVTFPKAGHKSAEPARRLPYRAHRRSGFLWWTPTKSFPMHYVNIYMTGLPIKTVRKVCSFQGKACSCHK